MLKCSWACVPWVDRKTGARHLDVVCSCGPCTWIYRTRAEQPVQLVWVIRHLQERVAEEYAKCPYES